MGIYSIDYIKIKGVTTKILDIKSNSEEVRNDYIYEIV